MSRSLPRPRRHLLLLLGALLVALAAAVTVPSAMDRMVLSRFESPGTESHRVDQTLSASDATGKQHILILVTARAGDVDAPEVAAEARRLAAELDALPETSDVSSYWDEGRSPAMRSRDGVQALITARLAGDVTQARRALADISPEFSREGSEIHTRVGGGDEIFRQAATQARTDFVRAEAIILPLILILLVALRRGLVGAVLTLMMGLFSVVTTLALLGVLARWVDISTFAGNLVLVMGIGLGVDYSLLVIDRFVEARGRGATPGEAVTGLRACVGRTVAFSGLIVAASLLGLLLFPFPFLQSFAHAGVLTVGTSMLAALVILPAALALVGGRIPVPRSPDGRRFWHRTATLMMRRPLRFALPVLVVLVLLASPVLGLRLGLPDARVLPQEVSSRQVQEEIEANFDAEFIDSLFLLPEEEVAAGKAGEYAAALSRMAGVAQVDSPAGRFIDGRQASDVTVPGHWYRVVPELATQGYGSLVDGVREVEAPSPVLVGGYPAELEDFQRSLLGAVPGVMILVLVVTWLLIAWMSGSLLVPTKALLLNVLSMAVMFGVLVWGFQEGNLASLLGFTADGSLEATFPILMFCIAFGMSMDYEVFLVARIREEWRRTGDVEASIATGLERSGPVVTSAALVLTLSFAVYATSSVMYLKMLAVGVATAIIVDATLIRMVLVPTLMRLAGAANWWLPFSGGGGRATTPAGSAP
ncbi:MMPL family transporter [Arachnia propionica]|uniref:MMPL family transporter n=1 Tax=Arachnia propionica TaxID=1750 RepID=A0A3P1WWQ0_9ACTN|nr:MMPL family transporter [Arachnia propionica]RRD50466.1 MMPL family transporter [Arachnia propionica]